MVNRSIFRLVAACSLTLALFASSQAQDKVDSKLKDEVEQSEKAAKVFQEIMGAPDKEIPREILDGAECVAVFPSVLKAGLIVGGQGGRGGQL